MALIKRMLGMQAESEARPMTEPTRQPLSPADVVSRKSPTGEIVAWNTRDSRQIASGFEDEADFEDWKQERFKL